MLRLLTAFVIGVLGVTTSAQANSLFDAAAHGDFATVKKLLDGGVDVDERGRNEETALIAAALAGDVAIAEILIAHGADVMARNKGGLTPLHAAAYSGSAEVAHLLLDHGAALEDKTNISGTTPLIVAAEENHVAVAELLLARGADLTITDRDGFDALSQAWAKKRVEVVRVLKQHGATCQPVAILGSEEYYRRCVQYEQ
jgi:ankyrin repeat protein